MHCDGFVKHVRWVNLTICEGLFYTSGCIQIISSLTLPLLETGSASFQMSVSPVDSNRTTIVVIDGEDERAEEECPDAPTQQEPHQHCTLVVTPPLPPSCHQH
jgi:hypothetical protein